MISDNIYSHIDKNGYTYSLFEDITDHIIYGSAVLKENTYSATKRRHMHLRNTTIGWKLKVTRKDNSEI